MNDGGAREDTLIYMTILVVIVLWLSMLMHYSKFYTAGGD